MEVDRQQLAFSGRLLNGKNAVARKELLKQLKQLHEELADLEQEAVDTSSLARVTREIASPALFYHPDGGVRAYTACCVADLLRLYAPEPPYSAAELSEIFHLFVKQLNHIGDAQSGYRALYLYLLESLATVKSVAIVTDLQDNEQLISAFFRCLFDVVSTETPQTVRMCIVDVLSQLIEESSFMPQDAVDIILGQFLSKNRLARQPAYHMACELCNGNVDRLQRYTCQYFTDVILAMGRLDDPLTDVQKQEVKTAHQLVVEMHRAAPGLLLNVIPQLEEELQLPEAYLRMLATSTLGELFSARESSVAQAYPSVWRAWIMQKDDRSTVVRVSWAEYLTRLYNHHPALGADLNEAVIDKLLDPDARVRAATCQAIGKMDPDVVIQHVSLEVLQELGRRCRDKKADPYSEAFKALGRLYRVTYAKHNEPHINKKLGWIPKLFLDVFYTGDNGIIATMEAYFVRDILSLDEDGTERAKRFAHVLSTLDAHAEKALLALLQYKSAAMKDVSAFLAACPEIKQHDLESIPQPLEDLLSRIALRLPLSESLKQDLVDFAQLADAQVVKRLSSCMDSATDYRTIRRYEADIRKRIGAVSQRMLETIVVLAGRASFSMIHPSMVTAALQIVAEAANCASVDVDHQVAATIRLLQHLACVFPVLFRANVILLVDLCQMPSPLIAEGCMSILATCATTLPNMAQLDKDAINIMMSKCYNGSTKEAKYSAAILACQPSGATYCRKFAQDVPTDTEPDHVKLLPQLAALSVFARRLPEALEPYGQHLVGYLVNTLLLTSTATDVEADDQAVWVDKSALSAHWLCKILALKFLANRVCGMTVHEPASELAQPVFKLLFTAVANDGELCTSGNSPPASKTWIRLTATAMILKLCRHSGLDVYVRNEAFRQLAYTVEDSVPQVREAIVQKLLKHIHARTLPSRFIALLLLTAHTSDSTLRQRVIMFLQKQQKAVSSVNEGRPSAFDLSVARLIHLLAYHSKFDTSTDALGFMAKFIEFHMESCVTAANVSFIYHIVTRIKITRDAESADIVDSDKSRNLYVLSDLAQLMIRERCASQQWVLAAFPGDIRLPRELFERLSVDEAAENLRTNHLPEAFVRAQATSVRSTHIAAKRAIMPSDNDKVRRKSAVGGEKRRRAIPTEMAVRRNAPRAARATRKMVDDDNSNDEMELDDPQSQESRAEVYDTSPSY